MKKIISILFVAIAFIAITNQINAAESKGESAKTSTYTVSVTATGTDTEVVPPQSMTAEVNTIDIKKIIADNWVAIVIAIMALIKVVVNLTPTATDNAVFFIFDKLINAIIPNIGKDGKLHDFHFIDLFRKKKKDEDNSASN
jgi:hypothetical protein